MRSFRRLQQQFKVGDNDCPDNEVYVSLQFRPEVWAGDTYFQSLA